MASEEMELLKVMRELRAEQPSHSEFKVNRPHVYMSLYWSERGVAGWGTATCHPRDVWNVTVGLAWAYDRAIENAARQLLERACRPEWAPSEQGGENMAVWYKCWQCAEYEPSRRLAGWGICHDGSAALQPGHTVACARFRLREEEPPEDAGDDDGGGKALGLEERVQALEAKVASLETDNRRLTKRVGKLEALERLDEKRLTRLEQGSVTLRERLVKLECERARSEQDLASL